MPGGKFAVEFTPREPSAAGLEGCEFQVAAHEGQTLGPLAKIASGGELSRVSLAIQMLASAKASVATMIFDEVDAGIGGRVAEVVGRLLRSLEATGLSQRTCIIFTALSGPSPEMNSLVEQTGSCGQFTHSKNGLSEGNLRVPFLVQWLGAISPATVSDEVLSLCDLLPTFVQLGWISRPVGRIDGQSLADVWRQRSSVPERRLSWKSSANGSPRAVRDRHWKLIVTNGAMQLFDLRSDPGEQSDVAAERADIVQGLAK